MRNLFCNDMIEAFKRKPFIFLTGDLGFKALEPLQKEMGEMFINAGVAEQNMIGVAAGIAKTGMKVFAYSIAPFAYARPFEQIRNDVCLHNLPVTIVGNGGGYGYGVMGGTHHAIEDYGAMLSLQNMHAFVPAIGADIKPMLQRIDEINGPAYLRLGLNEAFEGMETPTYGAWRKFLNGDNGVLIITGALAGGLIKQLKDEPEKTRPAVWVLSELPIINELPAELVKEMKGKKLCLLEEHVKHGGVGQMISEAVLENGISIGKFLHLHAKGYGSGYYGSQTFHRKENSLTVDAVNGFFK